MRQMSWTATIDEEMSTGYCRPMAVETQLQRVARFKRRELLEAAVAELVVSGWRGLQITSVALRAGVSRQTVYNTFGSRDRLAEALIDHLTQGFLDGFEARFRAEPDRLRQWTAGIEYILRRGIDDPALRAMLGAETSDQFLELLTSRSGPLVATAQARIASVSSDADLAPVAVQRTEIVAEIVTRLGLSNIVQPMTNIHEHASAVAKMVTRFIDEDPERPQGDEAPPVDALGPRARLESDRAVLGGPTGGVG